MRAVIMKLVAKLAASGIGRALSRVPWKKLFAYLLVLAKQVLKGIVLKHLYRHLWLYVGLTLFVTASIVTLIVLLIGALGGN